MEQGNLISTVVVFSAIGLLPLFIMISTCFLKIAVVMVIVRNALGIQQIPPTMAIYGMALVLTMIIMAPVINEIRHSINSAGIDQLDGGAVLEQLVTHMAPLKEFMDKYTDPSVKNALEESIALIWDGHDDLNIEDSILVSIPSFVVSEVQAGFTIGFLIYLPFLVVDILVSNLLLALGMQMVSPMTISMPLKILLFVVADGWKRLLESLVISYA